MVKNTGKIVNVNCERPRMAKKTYHGTDWVEWPSNPTFEIPNGAPEFTTFLEPMKPVITWFL